MLISVLVSLSFAAAPNLVKPKGITQEATVEGLTEYRLANGFKVLFVPDPSSPQVTVNLTVFVGSRHEDYGEKGMAHLFEHMLFKKTKKFADIKKTLSEMGGDANGTTSNDRTNYFEIFSANDDTVKGAIELEAERLASAIISRDQLVTEMTVVRNEFESGENRPNRVLSQRVTSAAYLWHNYGRATIGNRSDIEAVPTVRLQAFYEKYYQPDNAMLIVSGKFDEQKALQVIANTFGKIPKPKRSLPPQTYTVEPVQDGERSITVRRVGGTPLFNVQYHVPAATDPDFAPVDVLSNVLGVPPSGRLYRALVDSKKSAKAECFTSALNEAGTIECMVELTAKDAPGPAREAMLAELENVSKKPVTAAETERAKTQLLKQFELTLNSPDRIGIDISEYAALGDWRMFFIYRDRIKAVTVDDVNRVAQRYLKASNRTLGEYVPTEKPDRTEVPGLVELAPMLKAYKPAEGIAQGEVFAATPSNIEARTIRSALPNGMALALLSKKTRGEKVELAIKLGFGSPKTMMGQRATTLYLARMLQRGTKTKTREQFKDALDALNASLRIAPGAQSVTAIIEVRRPQLMAAVDLVAEALKAPAFDPKELESLRRESIAEAEAAKDEPSAVGRLVVRRLLNPYPKDHPYFAPSFDDLIAEAKEMKLDQIKALHVQLYGAQSGQVAAVGDFDTGELTAKLTAHFGSWTAPQPYERIARPYQAIAAKNLTVDLPDKANAYFGAALPMPVKDGDSDYVPLMVADYLLGGGFMAGRVTQRLREKEGLSYGAGTFLTVSPLDDSAALMGYAIYAPQNAGKIENGFKEELEKAVASGFTEAELKSALQGLKQGRSSSYADDGWVTMSLLEQAEVKRTFTYESNIDSRLEKISATQVSEALKKYVDPKSFSYVKAGDLKKIEAPR